MLLKIQQDAAHYSEDDYQDGDFYINTDYVSHMWQWSKKHWCVKMGVGELFIVNQEDYQRILEAMGFADSPTKDRGPN